MEAIHEDSEALVKLAPPSLGLIHPEVDARIEIEQEVPQPYAERRFKGHYLVPDDLKPDAADFRRQHRDQLRSRRHGRPTRVVAIALPPIEYLRKPITGIAGCCARTASGHA